MTVRTAVPRWARIAAHAVPLVILPSGLWRIGAMLGIPAFTTLPATTADHAYMLLLTVVAEGLGLLTLGLVRPWGEVVPRWVPVLGGRAVPPLAAVVPAALGALGVTVLVLFAGYNAFARGMLANLGGPLQQAVVTLCYAPLLAWGPLLAVVTIDYHRRRATTRWNT
ncbi:hypothetical protein [Amycolatopsis sp. 195334CR]|uniref:hypothetical protein n=1 Tax=Amycolatopsis sp. 195334CR TaxID=2814588 RepID=UPI001A8FC4D2|nr:hypothetical protein [Amycolatopsis sp. 195334CR]MBN6040550.1 hypothetical protein [Amycolatopsis sp. 195334CR]